MTNILPPEFEQAWLHQLDELAQQFGSEAVARLRTLKLGPGQGEQSNQRPTLAYLPGLQPAPWWDAASGSIGELTAWLEERFDPILQEALASTKSTAKHLEDYPHLTLNGDRADGWDVVFLCKSGVLAPEALDQHPTVAEMLHDFPRAGTFECFMSRLAPGTHLVPHCGTNNLVLTIHLPLVIPEGDCAIRVADETRVWERGQSIVFDDSFEHEAWNRTDEHRLALLVSFLHPDLTDVECAIISEVMPMLSKAYEDLLTTAGVS